MIDPATIAAIVAEARACFLEEDAPEYLTMLSQGIETLEAAFKNPSTATNLDRVYKDLGRAAHSLKGGAGMAELSSLNQVSHKLEDLLEALEQSRIEDKDTALQLMILASEEIHNLVDLATSGHEDNHSRLEIIGALEEFLTTASSATQAIDLSISNQSDFVKTALNVDLEAVLQRLENFINQKNPESVIQSEFKLLEAQCTFFGEAFNFPVLLELISLIQQLTSLQTISTVELSKLVIAEIRNLRSQFFEGKTPTISEAFTSLLPTPEKTPAQEKPRSDVPETSSRENEVYLRVPLSRLEFLSNTVGELLINYESLLLYENQLKQASFNIKKRFQQLNPLKEKVESIYDQQTINQETSTTSKEFDALEFDSYSEVHTTLQQFQELMVQVQEIREDIDLVNQEFHETLVTIKNSINHLDENLTQSRLVTFGTLANGFIQPIEKLSQRFQKSVNLIIEGDNVWVDQSVLEQLRTPLNHLIRNAFDHGIEAPQTRIDHGKNATGTIQLSAKTQSNQVVIELKDDGGGINLQKVYDKAVKLGLSPATKTIDKFTKEQVLSFIFQPGFSTTDKVTELSGRGLGLDIVKLQIEKLRGTIKVDTNSGQGSKFTINIPLSLNIVSLLLFRCQKQILAITSIEVKSIILLNDVEKNKNLTKIIWQEQEINLFPLANILPYNQANIFLPQDYLPKIALILSVNQNHVAIAIDEILDERQLVVKPFDEVIPVPPYVGGCTILGTGQVVPILLSDYFGSLWQNLEKEKKTQQPEEISILVIDDSIAVRRTLTQILTQCNYQVVECRDGKEAWDLLTQGNQPKFDLAISDLEMPRMDGFTLLQNLKSHPSWRKLPVMVLTSRENVLHRQKAMSLGASGYFTKPFNPALFLEAIANLLEN